MTYSTGKPQLWDHPTVPIREECSSSPYTSQQTTHSSHQRWHSPHASTIPTSTAMAAFALTFSDLSGPRPSPSPKCCYPSARCCATPTQTTRSCPRLPGYTRQTGKSTTSWPANGLASTPCDDANCHWLTTTTKQTCFFSSLSTVAAVTAVALLLLLLPDYTTSPFSLVLSTVSY